MAEKGQRLAAHHGRALWATAIDRQDARELINPPESSRTYSSQGEAAEAEALSVLGSKGEWKVASHDRSRWLALDLGSVRCVHGSSRRLEPSTRRVSLALLLTPSVLVHGMQRSSCSAARSCTPSRAGSPGCASRTLRTSPPPSGPSAAIF